MKTTYSVQIDLNNSTLSKTIYKSTFFDKKGIEKMIELNLKELTQEGETIEYGREDEKFAYAPLFTLEFKNGEVKNENK